MLHTALGGVGLVPLLLTGCLYITHADVVARHDLDGDGWATDEVEGGRDCDDNDALVHPRATERCGDVDDDCDGVLSRGELDLDEDGASPCDGDCDDDDPDIGPHVPERCDLDDVDEDCNGLAEDDDPMPLGGHSYFPDADGDFFGDHTSPGVAFCTPPAGWVALASDCDDTDPEVNPAMPERCDALDVDEDCNAVSDDDDVDVEGQVEVWPDQDVDGVGDPDSVSEWWCEVPDGWTTTPPS